MRLFSGSHTRPLLVIATALAICIFALTVGVLPRLRHAPGADAVGQGTVQPIAGPIIQGHRTTLPVQMVTCATPIPATFNNPCRLGAYEVKMTYDATKFTMLTEIGSVGDAANPNTTGYATSTTLTDLSKTWNVNQWAGMQVVMRLGPGSTGADGALQFRSIVSNTTNTLTITPGWDAGTAALMNNSTKYAIGGVGVSSGGNTSTTLKDLGKSWKANQWAGSRVTLLGGPGYTGADGNPQSRIVVSNGKCTQPPPNPIPAGDCTLTVSPAWDGGAIPLPGNTTRYMVGGMTDGGFLGSTGRPMLCPNDPIYGQGTAQISCFTLGNVPPAGATGTGNLTVLTVQTASGAVGATPCGGPGAWVPCAPRGIVSLGLVMPDTQVLRVDGFDILADYANGNRRIMLCPDVNPVPDNLVSAIDLSLIAQQFLKRVGDVGYTIQRDPDENGIVTSIDLSLTAQVFGKRCTQQ